MGVSATPGSSARRNWLRYFSARGPLLHVAGALDELAIPFVLVKGMVTADLLYESPAERPISDIDIRILPRDFGRAVQLARQRGWYQRPDVILRQALWKIGGWEIDVKSAIGPPGLCAIGVAEILDRAERATTLFELSHYRPELTDHALLLVVNAFKDGLRTTPWALEDLRRIVRHERFDPAVLVQRARQGLVASALWITADFLAQDCGAIEWRTVRDRIGRRPPSARAAGVYGAWRTAGCPPKPGLFVVASSGDTSWRSVSGAALAAAGVVQGRALRLLHHRRTKAV